MLITFIAMSALAAGPAVELPVAADYDVTTETLSGPPPDLAPPRSVRLRPAALSVPTRLAWSALPNGLHLLDNGLAWWLRAPSASGAAPYPEAPPETSDEPRYTTWSQLRAQIVGGVVRAVSGRERTVEHGRFTEISYRVWTVRYDDQGRATEVWGDGHSSGFGGPRLAQRRLVLTWSEDGAVTAMEETTCRGPSREDPSSGCVRVTAIAAPGREP